MERMVKAKELQAIIQGLQNLYASVRSRPAPQEFKHPAIKVNRPRSGCCAFLLFLYTPLAPMAGLDVLPGEHPSPGGIAAASQQFEFS